MTPNTPPADSLDDHDPETTSAADADWLAELRANARSSGRLRADDVEEPVDEEVDIDPIDDDEETIAASGDAFEQVRAAVRAARNQPDDDAIDRTSTPPPAPEPPTSAAATPATEEEPGDTDFVIPVAPRPASRPAAAQPTTIAFPENRGTPVARRADLPTPTAGPRWEAPPRLEGSKENTEPVFSSQLQPTRSIDWRVAVGAVAAALAIGAIAAMLLSGGDESPTVPVDTGPVDSVVVDSEVGDSELGDSGELGS